MVTKLITNGRSSALGMWSSDHAIRFASTRQGGRLNKMLRRCGGTKRNSGPSARSPLTMRAPSGKASFCPSPVAVTLTPSILASCGPMNCALSSGSLVKSPVASTMPPRARKWRAPSAVSQSIATTRPFSETSAVARAPHTIVTPARRAALARLVMKESELGSTLCMRGLLCGGSGIGP